ncbi:DUF423-domain-containing protein [Atractiella rhizophila]|nr:DUF423-domain-containing protein [Atractiella rhizophila]
MATPLFCNTLMKAGALMSTVGICAGAMGSHALKPRLGETSTWLTSSNYLLMNGIAVLAISSHPRLYRHKLSAPLILAGATLFSGSIFLLLLAKEKFKWLGPVTPIGGTLMIVGYASILFVA